MQPSIEMRWFRSGELPKPLVEWVGRWPFKPQEDRRDDTYLFDPTSELGIKLRAGKNIEVKQRVSDDGALKAGPLDGRVERWVKWSFSLDPKPPELFPPPDITRPAGA